MRNKKCDKYYFLSIDNDMVGPFAWSDFNKLNLAEETKVMCDKEKKWTSYKEIKTIHRNRNRQNIFIVCGCLLLIAIVSCFIIFRDRTHDLLKENSYESEELNVYIEKYYRDIEFFGISKVKPRNVIVRMAPMQYFENTKDYHGISFGYNNDELIEIYINEDSWKKLSKPQRYWIMYHELSHDILNVDDEPENSYDASHLMCPFMDTFNKISMDDFIEASHQLFNDYIDKE